ncbi:MAG TPA: RnfABCDGE type electron transport complex subunit A, partial [Spirochaetota bacterium]|nr:RnfABCDGE type electron transport complex subunit A [Spirochaetota bacterium]
MDMGELIAVSIGTIFINNYVLARFLGLCSFIGVSKNLDSVLGMSLAVTFVMTIASMVTFVISHYVLQPAGIGFLQTISFILVIATLVQMIEIIMKKMFPALYSALGIYLPLITVNCAVLGVAVINIQENYNFITSTVNGFMAGIGFMLALFLMATIRVKLDSADVPESFKGAPIAFITAGLMALAFLAA